MTINLQNINTFLSTLSLVLCVVGYQLVTTLFLPSSSDLEGISQSVTVPFRAFALMVMAAVILINLRRRVGPLSAPMVVLLLYWFFLVVRMVYDIYLSGEVFLASTSQLWLYVFGICLAGVFSVLKSYDAIDYDRAFRWIIWAVAVTLLITLFSNQSLISNTDNEYRVDANIALNTISYGNFGVMGIYLSIFYLMQRKRNLFFKILTAALLALSVYSMLRSGSRGPILALLVVFLFWFFAKGRNVVVGFVTVLLSLCLIYLFRDALLNFMGDIAPVIESRLRETIEGDGPDERSKLHDTAITAFLDSPFIGKQFAIFDNAGGYAYAHNIILDALMALGFGGGIAMIYILASALKSGYFAIKNNAKTYWISLILVHQISVLMLSGTFYQDQLLSVFLVLHFNLFRKKTIIWK